MEVRAASVDDAEAVAAVHVLSWQGAYRGLIPDAYLDTLSVRRRHEIWSRIPAEADLPRTGAFVLQDGLEVIGFTHVAPTRDEGLPASTGEVTALYVAPSAWGVGGGRRLLDTAKSATPRLSSWGRAGLAASVSLRRADRPASGRTRPSRSDRCPRGPVAESATG